VVRAEVGADVGVLDDVRRDELAGRVRAAVLDGLGIDAAVEILDRETLPRSGYKLKRVIDA
jgi:signal transduction histidine kinase